MIAQEAAGLKAQKAEFARREDKLFRAFSEGAGEEGYVSRQYRCGCGFTTNSPQKIFDHALGCSQECRADGPT